MAPVKETIHQNPKSLSKRAAAAARKKELEKKTEKKKENRQEAREAEMMGEMVGGMRETAVDVGLRAMKRELGAMAREAFLVVGETEEKEKKKLEETEERLEKMNLSE